MDILDVIIVAAFLLQMLNYVILGRGRVNKPLFITVLLLFCVSESILAVKQTPALWLYVALNLWGIVNLVLQKERP